ncbi:VOC family protein [Nocardioides sp. CER19]|uniref:VOC family protein n=1 Tax=Nocardioides sp. CER19 TaxID=3038538 RepID=UPI00244960C0|nr:VOC family protein [Nocardioides sp. CER19]MDH2414114.1 VOC family protein [Nocardioides sp. CER19]
MDQRISLVTLAVGDVAASRAFYCERLGWQEFMYVPGEVCMIRAGDHLIFSLWDETHFEAEIGQPIRRGEGVAPLTIAHNVATEAEVDAVLETARAAGADPMSTAVEREWGGYTGYFADPDGYRWEVAYAPGEIAKVVLP